MPTPTPPTPQTPSPQLVLAATLIADAAQLLDELAVDSAAARQWLVRYRQWLHDGLAACRSTEEATRA